MINYKELANEELIRLGRGGDEYAENLLMEKNMGLVHMLMKNYLNKGISYEDVQSSAVYGLCRAYKYFDLEGGYKFTTFTSKVIINELNKLYIYTHKDKRKGTTVSLSEPIASVDGEIQLIEALHENPSHNYSVPFEATYNLLLEDFNKRATEKQKKVFDLTVNKKFNRTEVGKMLGYTHQNISNILKKIANTYFRPLLEV